MSKPMWAACVAIAGTALSAAAGTESQTVSFDNDLYSDYQSPVFAKFDTMGGTRRLDAVTFSFDHRIDTVLTLENASPFAVTADMYGFQFLMQCLFQLGTVDDPEDNPPFVGAGGFATEMWSVDLPAYEGDPVPPWGPAPGLDVFYSGVMTAHNTFAERHTSASILAAVTGAGDLQTVLGGFGEAYFQWNVFLEEGLVFAGVDSLRHYGAFTVTYEYTLIPAPAGVGALAGAGLLATRRRRG